MKTRNPKSRNPKEVRNPKAEKERQFVVRNSGFFRSSAFGFRIFEWLPDMDLNHDKQIQSLLCYRYTIGQAGATTRLSVFRRESSC